MFFFERVNSEGNKSNADTVRHLVGNLSVAGKTKQATAVQTTYCVITEQRKAITKRNTERKVAADQ